MKSFVRYVRTPVIVGYVIVICVWSVLIFRWGRLTDIPLTSRGGILHVSHIWDPLIIIFFSIAFKLAWAIPVRDRMLWPSDKSALSDAASAFFIVVSACGIVLTVTYGLFGFILTLGFLALGIPGGVFLIAIMKLGHWLWSKRSSGSSRLVTL